MSLDLDIEMSAMGLVSDLCRAGKEDQARAVLALVRGQAVAVPLSFLEPCPAEAELRASGAACAACDGEGGELRMGWADGSWQTCMSCGGSGRDADLEALLSRLDEWRKGLPL